MIEVDNKSSFPMGSSNIGSLLASLHAGYEPEKKMIFSLEDIVMLSANNIDLDFALTSKWLHQVFPINSQNQFYPLKGGFQTDSEYSRRHRSLNTSEERELVPWNPDDPDFVEVELEGPKTQERKTKISRNRTTSGADQDLNWRKVSEGSSTNGWKAEDMFQTNEDKLGVKSDYDPEMKIYT